MNQTKHINELITITHTIALELWLQTASLDEIRQLRDCDTWGIATVFCPRQPNGRRDANGRKNLARDVRDGHLR